RALGLLQCAGEDVRDGDVVDRRMTGLEHPQRARRVDEGHASEDDADAARRRLDARWTRVVPHRFLSGPLWERRGSHARWIAEPPADHPTARTTACPARSR